MDVDIVIDEDVVDDKEMNLVLQVVINVVDQVIECRFPWSCEKVSVNFNTSKI